MNYNPNEVFVKIKKLEFKFLLLPLLLIIADFIIVLNYKITTLKYFSLALLIIYFFIKILFRIDKITVENSENTIKSPITGKVIQVEKDKIIIEKGMFEKADIRSSFATFKPIKGKIYIFADYNEQSILIGVAPGYIKMEIILPENANITLQPNQKVIAGVTDIGKINE